MESIIAKLRTLVMSHYECEDPWYSCPMSAGESADDRAEGCTCGSEDRNRLIEEIIKDIERLSMDGDRSLV